METFKAIMIGDAGVGKTSLSRALRGETFEPRYIKTNWMSSGSNSSWTTLPTCFDKCVGLGR
jgi:GTPase SAR1 family protein